MLALGLLASCSDDDGGDQRAQSATTTTTTPTSTASVDCELTTDVVDTGASVDVVAVRCDGQRLTLDGQPVAFPVGGTVTHGEGVRCDSESGRVTVLSATSDDGTRYDATAVTYAVEDAALVEVDRHTSTIDATTEPGTLDPYYRLDC